VSVPAPPPNVVDRGPRPRALTLGVILVLVLAALSLVSFVLTLANLDALVEESIRQADTGDSTPANVESIMRVWVIAVSTVTVLVAALVAVFALLALRGRNWARITVAVLMVLSAVFGLISLAGGLVSPPEGLPGGYTATATVIGVVQFLAATGAAVLLLLSAAGNWYARR
jgi:heme/copper-type cytochrome/quinol oxidase subunit 3